MSTNTETGAPTPAGNPGALRRHPLALTISLACAAGHATAQDAGTDQIIVTGTRVESTVLKSSASIQVVGGEALRATGQNDLRTALSQVSPSYIAVNSNGGALAKNTRGSSLRGLSGNQVLILVNGKRRHGSSMINNSGGSTLGSSAADLAHIPVSAVERVEVLTDAASALYGSDAIAGVINIILRSDALGGSANVLYGEYDHSTAKVNGVGDAGRTTTLDLNQGLELGSDGGFLNLSASILQTKNSHTVGAWKQPSKPIWQIYGDPNDPREATTDRRLHSNIEVVPLQKLGNLSYNAELPLSNGLKVTSFATYSQRDSEAKGSYRTETNGTANVFTTPGGYGPSLQTKEEDYQFNIGITDGVVLGWNWSAGLSYGRNDANIAVLNTINASFGTLVPLQDMHAGSLRFEESIADFTVRRAFDTGVFEKTLQVSAGVEYRHDQLKLRAGDYYSYAGGGYRFPNDYPAVNLRGTLAGAGSAFLTGFLPQFEFDESRNNQALFLDLSQKLTSRWDAGAAARWENYSDFGSALSGKLSTRFEVSSDIALRGSVSTGFRAPSLHEQHYQSATVQPTNDPITNTTYISYNYDTLSPDAPAAKALGAEALKPEKSNNYSVGVVFTPARNLSTSIDVYQIDIKDRIYLTGAFNGFNNTAVANILTAAGLTAQQSVRYFSNIGDTRTRGLELKADYAADYASYGKARWGLAYAQNRQKVKRVNTPAALQGTGLSLLGRDRYVLLEESLPQHIVRGSVNWRYGEFEFDVVESWYSQTRTVNNVTNVNQDSITDPAFITDAAVSYHFGKSIKATLGARNLFNKKAPNQPDSLASTLNYENPYPNQNTPWGFGGGFYYARLSYVW